MIKKKLINTAVIIETTIEENILNDTIYWQVIAFCFIQKTDENFEMW